MNNLLDEGGRVFAFFLSSIIVWGAILSGNGTTILVSLVIAGIIYKTGIKKD